MPRFLIDANLPYRFSVWRGRSYSHVFDIGDEMKDRAIWDYAKEHDLVIVSKDTDFSDLAMLHPPPPRVVQICFGNLKMREFHAAIRKSWPWVEANAGSFRLIRVFEDEIEAVE